MGDMTTDQGRALAEAARCVEIGGIVGAFYTRLGPQNDPADPIDVEELQEGMHVRNLIVGDRVVADGSDQPTPAAVACNWFTNTSPVSIVHESQDEQFQFPTRIFHQRYTPLNPSAVEVAGPSATGNGVIPRAVGTVPCRDTFNLKLRARLEDDQGLYWHCASHTPNTVNWLTSEYSAVSTMVGTIFYRIRF